MDKFDLIRSVIIQLDELADARGAKKCTLIVDMIGKLDALAKGLGDEDKAKEKEKALLEEQLKALTTPPPLQEGEMRIGGETKHFDFTEVSADAGAQSDP